MPYTPGQMIETKDPDLGLIRMYIQEKKASCGPCCVRTIVNLLTGKDVPEQTLRDMAEQEEVRLGVTGTHDWDQWGTWQIDAMLSGQNLKFTFHKSAAPLQQTSKMRPGIAVIQFPSTLHYVVVAGLTTSDEGIILDPQAGRQNAPKLGNEFDTYNPVDPVDKTMFGGWWQQYCWTIG